jgi:hypothetical protein
MTEKDLLKIIEDAIISEYSKGDEIVIVANEDTIAKILNEVHEKFWETTKAKYSDKQVMLDFNGEDNE